MSKETKFTRGEWRIVKSVAFDSDMGNIGETTMLSIGSRIFPICHHGIQGKCFDYEEQVANAQLIKTAPKLYDALDRFISLVDDDHSEDFLYKYQEIKTLLAEARGEQ